MSLNRSNPMDDTREAKLVRLRQAVAEGFENGPTEAFDFKEFLVEMNSSEKDQE